MYNTVGRARGVFGFQLVRCGLLVFRFFAVCTFLSIVPCTFVHMQYVERSSSEISSIRIFVMFPNWIAW
jgi:hypothetical protein